MTLRAPVVAIVGATATGKSAVAIAVAEHIGGEIINADAFQFYRGMDIGTAKVTAVERARVPHHQLDTLDLADEASVADYQRSAREDIADIQARGNTPVVAGGSGLYLRALLDRFDFPGTDPTLRAELESRAREEGTGPLMAELQRLQPEVAARIDPRNVKRLVRALEIAHLQPGAPVGTLPTHVNEIPTVHVGLAMDYEALDRRIERRVTRMWDSGLVEEVAALADAGLRESPTARRAVGYGETLEFLDGVRSASETRDLIAQRTRRLARKQAQWFRPDPRVTWVQAPADDQDVADVASAVIGTLRP